MATVSSSPLVSVCIIARNEAKRIAECIRSFRACAGEINLVDTGSTDGTQAIGHRNGARVFQMAWPDCFATARNESLRVSRGLWNLWVDADDVGDRAFCDGVLKLVRSCPKRDAAFHIAVRIPPGPGEYSWGRVDHLKLLPNLPGLRFEHRIHEQILEPAKRAGLDIRFTDLYVTHKNYDRSPEGQALKRRRDFRLLELDLRDWPEHAFTLFNLGMTYLHATKEYVVAAQYLQRCLERTSPQDSIFCSAHVKLAYAFSGQGELEPAIAVNESARRFHPDDEELLFQASRLYQDQERFGEARLALERLVGGSDRIGYHNGSMDLRTCQGPHALAMLYHRMGDAPHAEADLRRLVEEQPQYVPARQGLVQVLSDQGKRMEAERFGRGLPA